MDTTDVPAASDARVEGFAQVCRWLLAPLAVGAGAIHLSMVSGHAQEWLAEGIAFAVVAWAQLGLALLLVVRPSRRAVAALAGLSLVCVVAWAWTRTVGFPFGPAVGTTEEAGTVDLLCAGFEAVTAVACLVVLFRPPLRRGAGIPATLAAAVPLIAVLGMTTAALASPAGLHEHTEGDDGHPHAGEQAADHEDTHAEGESAAADDHPHDAATEGTTTEAETSHSHGEPCTAPVTEEQQDAADALVVESRTGMDAYQDFDAAVADGYVNITPEIGVLVHYARYDLMLDEATLDPTAIESLMYYRPRDGSDPVLVGAMYFADPGTAGPEIGGCLTQWHVHDNLCIAPGEGMVGVVDPEGSCPAGSSNDVTQEMLHVWDIDLPTGPFSELGEADRTAIAAAVVEKVAEQQTA
jgi:hypothetical protein